MNFESPDTSLVPSRALLMEIIESARTEDHRVHETHVLTLIHALGRLTQVLIMLKGDKSCFCSMPAHSVACRKASECLDLLGEK